MLLLIVKSSLQCATEIIILIDCRLSDGVGPATERQRPPVHASLREIRSVESVQDDERLVGELRGRVAHHQVTDRGLRRTPPRPALRLGGGSECRSACGPRQSALAADAVVDNCPIGI